MTIHVIGAGIIGLSTAIRLLEKNFDVTIVAQTTTPQTTSDIAAAYWAPSDSMKDDRKRNWALVSKRRLLELCQDEASGVTVMPKLRLSRDLPDIAFTEHLPKFQYVSADTFPDPWYFAYSFNTFQFDVPSYMPYLFNRFKTLGGRLELRALQSLSDLEAEVIINCSGLGAKKLAKDDGVYPIRGQIMRVSQSKNLTQQILYAEDEGVVTYIVPRKDDIVLGGTYQYDLDDESVNPTTAQEIWERCLTLEPKLVETELLEHRVGLRPARTEVRLERDPEQANLIHNYGHGSIGHTLAWGCAETVLELVSNF